MKSKNSSMSSRLALASVAINNAKSDPRIGTLLVQYGYGPAKLQEGAALLDAAVSACQLKVSLGGASKTSTAAIQEAFSEAKAAYQELAQVCRAIFGLNNPVLSSLGLNRPAPARQAELLARASALFDNALGSASITASLSQYGYPPAKLGAEKEKVTALANALQQREAANGLSQQATVDRDKALERLYGWMGAFWRVAKVALRDYPQLLEELGLVARYGKTHAQQQAPFKASRTKQARKAVALHPASPQAPVLAEKASS